MSFCNGIPSSVDAGGLMSKLMFGKGTQVSIISGESFQVAPFAAPWTSVANPFPGDLGLTMARLTVSVTTVLQRPL